MATFTVIYDANVLYPAPLRSVLMFLAQTDLFRARWQAPGSWVARHEKDGLHLDHPVGHTETAPEHAAQG